MTVMYGFKGTAGNKLTSQQKTCNFKNDTVDDNAKTMLQIPESICKLE